MTYCVIEEREIKQNKIRSAISISAVKPHPRALLARLPAVTGLYCRNCYSGDLELNLSQEESLFAECWMTSD